MVALNARSGTLTANAVTSVPVTDSYPDGIWVINRSQSGQIWVRFDGTNPTVAGDDCYVVLGARYFPPQNAAETRTVKLISADALDYTVEGTVLA